MPLGAGPWVDRCSHFMNPDHWTAGVESGRLLYIKLSFCEPALAALHPLF